MTKGSKIEGRWSARTAVQFTFINALRAVYGKATAGRPFLPLYEPPEDEDERRWRQHPNGPARDY